MTKSNLHLVPPTFIRRQSLVGGERFTTDRLADLESEINDASERIVEIEKKLFLEVRARGEGGGALAPGGLRRRFRAGRLPGLCLRGNGARLRAAA